MSSSPPPPPDPARLYHSDYCSWSRQQAAALRRRDAGALDWENLAEEVESAAGEQRWRWVAHCASAIEHLLALQRVRPLPGLLRELAGRVLAARKGMADALDEAPGLQPALEGLLALAWRRGRREAAYRLAVHWAAAEGAPGAERLYREGWRAKLPAECPYSLEQVAAYDPRRDLEPRDDAWPPRLVPRLNKVLGEHYPGADLAPGGPPPAASPATGAPFPPEGPDEAAGVQ